MTALTGPAPRVVIADDQELVRTGFRLILTARGLNVVGEARRRSRGRQSRTPPTAAGTGDQGGVDVGVEVEGGQHDHSAARGGFLLKDVTPAHLAAAVRLVDTGDALLAPSITRRPVERHASMLDGPLVVQHSPPSTVTLPS